MISQDIRDAIAVHAHELPTEEVCGFVILRHEDGQAMILRQPNILPDRDRVEAFLMPNGAAGAAAALGDVVAVYHSHPTQSPKATDADVLTAEELELPFIIYAPWAQLWSVYEPIGRVREYEDRPYLFGLLDCFTLWRDWHAGELGLNFPDIPREAAFWTKGIRLWETHLPQHDFRPVVGKIRSLGGNLPPGAIVGDRQRGDTILFSLTSNNEPNPEGIWNHCAIDLGDGLILHHPYHRRSKVVPYVDEMGYYAKHYAATFRHASQIAS